MASVMFRITDLMNNSQAEAISIHLPFVNSAAGTDISEEQAIVAYEALNPFVTFEDQAAWYLDDDNPTNYKYAMGSLIKMWEEKELFEKDSVKVEDISIAAEVYVKFLEMKKNTEDLITEAETLIAEAGGIDMSTSSEMLEEAKYYYDAYDYLDSMRFAEAAVNWAKYLVSK